MWKASVLQKFKTSRLPCQLSDTNATQNSYELLETTRFIDDIVSVIGTAKSRIYMQFYAFENDDVGRPIAEELIKARVSNDVDVLFMADDIIRLEHDDHFIYVPRVDRRLQRRIVQKRKSTLRLFEEMRAVGIKIKITNPRGRMFQRMLLRDHKKLAIIDDSIGYVGGINISDHNASWNDFMVKMGGDMIPLLRADFDRTWHDQNTGGIAEYNDGLVIADARKRSIIIPIARHLIDLACNQVMIETPLLLSKGIVRSLIQASRRGVHVTVTVPRDRRNRSLDRLVKAGVRVYRFEEKTHTKALLADSVGLFGSNNFNDFLAGKANEIGIATDNINLVRQLERFMIWNRCRSATQY